jgi:hypothetical protein
LTVLNENDQLASDQTEICDIFNDFYVNVAKDLGNGSMIIDSDHVSIKKIVENHSDIDELIFKPVTSDFVSKQIKGMNSKKATGHDNISVKMMKIASPVIAQPVADLVNRCLEESVFPDNMKVAQVVPVHKKNSVLDKSNYRPVSLLPIASKVFERAIYVQLMDHFEKIFNPFLSAFRPGYGCNTTLLKIIEDWKYFLDNNMYVAAVLMDLSKAFDCLPHDLLLLKLKHYNTSDQSVKLIKSYLSNRKQCVKIGSVCSNFRSIIKGVPQGSILGPVLFNIFINDIFYFVDNGQLYNYADDNTLSYASHCKDDLVKTLESESLKLIEWFSNNHMKANPEKFQAIALGKKTHRENIHFNLDTITISCDEEVKLLGVNLDFMLNFNSHVSYICRKASKQLNVLKRIGRHLNRLGRLTIYHSFILSNFNYCPLTWHFTNDSNTRKMEKIQERALRFIYEDYSSNYEQLLIKSGLVSLKIRRIRYIALETYKILNRLNPSYLHDLVKYKNNHYNFRYTNTVEIPQPRTENYGKKSFRYAAAKLWNSLPENFRTATSFNQFRTLVNNWHEDKCICASCSIT